MTNQDLPSYSIFNKIHQISIKRAIMFNIVSCIFRLFFNKKPNPNKNGKNYLNLGCGLLRYDNYINADFFLRFSWFKHPYFPNWLLDIRYPLKCDDNFWDGIFTQHTLEHIYPIEGLQLLRELYRTLKPGAWLRISVPDLEKYVSYYNGIIPHEKFKQWDTGAEAICSLTQNYSHLACWDSKLLSKLLINIGFRNIKKVNFMESTDPMLAMDGIEHEFESLYIEAQK
jgi:hypothetical protein